MMRNLVSASAAGEFFHAGTKDARVTCERFGAVGRLIITSEMARKCPISTAAAGHLRHAPATTAVNIIVIEIRWPA